MSDGNENSKNLTLVQEDAELSELMNSAMADLGKKENKKIQRCTDDDLDTFMEQLDQQAIQDASKNFETMLDAIMKKVESERDTNEGNFSDDDKNFFNDMKKFMETANAINNGCSEEEMNKIMKEFEDPNSFMKNFTEMLMEEMTNKETMYPPIKEIRDKFPQFLEEKSSTLNEEELQKYKNQHEVVERICVEFERDNYDENDEDQKGERIILLTKMFNELHSYGFVPQELSPNVENMGDPESCTIIFIIMVDLCYETVLERNYQRHEIDGYKDLCYIRHNSGVIVVTLNKNHEAFNEEITKVDWDVNKKGVDRIKNTVSGKGKKGARTLFPDTKLCIITTKSGKEYPLKFGMKANCIEVNDRLENDPDLVRKYSENHGYLAIVMPNNDDRRCLPKVFKYE